MTAAEKTAEATTAKKATAAAALKVKDAKSNLASTLATLNSCYGTEKATTAVLKTAANKDTCNEDFNAW